MQEATTTDEVAALEATTTTTAAAIKRSTGLVKSRKGRLAAKVNPRQMFFSLSLVLGFSQAKQPDLDSRNCRSMQAPVSKGTKNQRRRFGHSLFPVFLFFPFKVSRCAPAAQ
jgi:hypothetical protein